MSDVIAKRAKQYTLAQLKRSPRMMGELEGRRVRIWSGEWSAWWRPEGCGYTNKADEAGVYDFANAYERTRHCGREKLIGFQVVD